MHFQDGRNRVSVTIRKLIRDYYRLAGGHVSNTAPTGLIVLVRGRRS
jgi:hypothetical protein